jgi:predicted PurR-regulated permease PerM
LQYIPVSFHEDILESYNSINNVVPQIVRKIIRNFGTLQSFFSQFFTFIVISPIASYYMIKDWEKINEGIVNLVPASSRASFVELRTEIRQRLAGYLAGQLYIILFFCIFYSIGLSIMGLKFAFTIGILTGIATIVPYIGFACGFVVGIITAILQTSDATYTAIIIGIFTAGQIIESTLLTPKLMSSKISIHPLWIVFGFMFFGALFGFLGVFFAVPLTAIFSVLIKFYVKNYYQKHCI